MLAVMMVCAWNRRGILLGLEQGRYKTRTPKLDRQLDLLLEPTRERGKKTVDAFHSDVIKF